MNLEQTKKVRTVSSPSLRRVAIAPSGNEVRHENMVLVDSIVELENFIIILSVLYIDLEQGQSNQCWLLTE